MLFRVRTCFILALCSVLVAGCQAPGATGAKVSAAAGKSAPAPNQLESDGTEADTAIAPSGDDSAANDNSENLIEAHAHYAAGVVHEMDLEPEAALDEYYQAARLDPANAPLVLDVSQQFLEAKQTDKALDLLKRASKTPSAPGAVFAELGFVYSKLGKTNEAIRADRQAIQKDPRSIAGYQSLFLDYLQNNQITQVWPVLDQATRVKGADSGFLIGLAELYLRVSVQAPAQKKNADEQALAVLQRAAKLKTTDLRLQLHLAEGFNLLGKADEAAGVYEDISKELPDDSPQQDTVRAKLADIYLNKHDLKRASTELEGLLRDNPTDPQTYYVLGGIAYDQTNYAKAADYFRQAISINPDLENAYYDLATALLGTDKVADAVGILDKARSKFPQNFTVEYLSGVAYSAQKDYTNALHHFTTAEVIAETADPKRAAERLTDAFYFQLGATCERLGDYAQAAKYFEHSLRLAPDSPETLNYLGYMWAEHGEKLDKARELIAKAVKADPKNAAYLDSMAWVLYKLQQPKPALTYALKAIQFSEEEDATLYDHLGDIYAALGQRDKAHEAWTKSLSLEASDAVRKKLQSDTK